MKPNLPELLETKFGGDQSVPIKKGVFHSRNFSQSATSNMLLQLDKIKVHAVDLENGLSPNVQFRSSRRMGQALFEDHNSYRMNTISNIAYEMISGKKTKGVMPINPTYGRASPDVRLDPYLQTNPDFNQNSTIKESSVHNPLFKETAIWLNSHRKSQHTNKIDEVATKGIRRFDLATNLEFHPKPDMANF